MTGRTSTLAQLSLLALLAGCSAAGPDDGTGGAAATNPTWVTGTWSGLIKATDKTAEFKGSQLYATFTPDPNDKSDRPAGTFEFIYQDVKDAHTKGTFRPMGAANVLLQPSDSNLSLLAQSVPLDLALEITSDTLFLHDDDMKITVVRTTAAAPGTPAPTPSTTGPVSTASTNLGGHWSCGDATGRTWLVFVKSDTAFDTEIRQANNPTVAMSGSIGLVAGDTARDAVFSVTSSNNPKAVGLEMSAKLQGDIDMQLAIKGGETMACHKTPDQ